MNTNFDTLYGRLKQERERLLSELEQQETGAPTAEVRREGSPFGKREEEANEAFELEKRLVLEQQARELLAEVEHALSKYEEGTYGLCDQCGQPIGPARLEALPQASLCLNCKASQTKDAKRKKPPR